MIVHAEMTRSVHYVRNSHNTATLTRAQVIYTPHFIETPAYNQHGTSSVIPLYFLFIDYEPTFDMLIRLHPENPQPRQLSAIVECLLDGGVIIYPTDTIYGLGCDIFQRKGIERIARIKNIDPEKAQLSFVCCDLSDLSAYTKSISTPLYRLLKDYLPGPYTFILPASKEVPKILQSKKNTIGLRIPDNKIANTIVQKLDHPLLSASLPGEMVEEYTDPELIYENFKKLVDIVIDGGPGGMVPSTIVDCTKEPYELIRQGLGEWRETED